MDDPLRVVLAEDEAIVREGVTAMLSRVGMRVVASVADAGDLLRVAVAEKPDVVIADIQMPPNYAGDGLQAAMKVRTLLPGTAVIVLSQFLEATYALDLIGDDPTGVGYLLKENVADVHALTSAIERVVGGGSALDPDVISILVGRTGKNDPLSFLTPKEREVLSLMAQGHSNSGIAEKLCVTVPAVERHVTGIFLKLGLPPKATQHRRVLAVLEYLNR